MEGGRFALIQFCHAPWLPPDIGLNERFGFSLAASDGLLFATQYSVHSVIRAYSLVPPSGVLAVDAAYCATHGLAAFDGRCISEALAEAHEFEGAIGVVAIAPGVFCCGLLAGHPCVGWN